MTKRMLIDASHAEETRVVVLEGNRLEDYDVETATKKQLKGNIYLAKIVRVEPSLQAAFVEYGGNRHGFLAFGEIHPDYYQIPVADRQRLLELQEEEAEAERVEDERRAAAAEAAEAALASRGEHGQDVVGAEAEDANPEDATGGGVEDGGPEGHEPASGNAGSGAAEIESGDGVEQGGEEAVDDTAMVAPGSGAVAELSGAELGRGQRIAESAVEDDAGGDERSDRRTSQRLLRHYKIQEVIRRRQIVLVQVVKEERGSKGAALTTYISLAGRYSVLMPNSPRGGGVSRKITAAADRRRLKEITTELAIPRGMAMIVRTAGAQRPKPEIKRDCEYLLRLWDDIRDNTMAAVAPALIHEEANLIKRAIRDVYATDFDDIQVDGETGWRAARDFMRTLMPPNARKVQLWRDGTPLFARHGVEGMLDAMLSPNVQLRSGGYLVINQAEALVAIDVNSGRSTRERGIEETALRTNLEAADEVARQLRLRDLAGLIVIDFIDMESRRHNAMVERRLKDALRHDRARLQVGAISAFGLLEMSRQRLRPSLAESSFSPCAHCGGTGLQRSTESASLHVLRAVEAAGAGREIAELAVTVATPVALYILNQKRAWLAEIERRCVMQVSFATDDALDGAAFRLSRQRSRAPDEIPPMPAARLTPPVADAVDVAAVPFADDAADDDDADDGDTGAGDAGAGDAGAGDRPVGRPALDAAADQAASGAGERVTAGAGADDDDGDRKRGKRRRRRRRGGRREDEAQAGENAEGDVDGNDESVPVVVSGEPMLQADAPALVDPDRNAGNGNAGVIASSDAGAIASSDAGDGGGRKRRGRRGGRRRRRDNETGETNLSTAAGDTDGDAEDAEPVPPPRYNGPTPADPFGGAYDIFEVLERDETAADRGPTLPNPAATAASLAPANAPDGDEQPLAIAALPRSREAPATIAAADADPQPATATEPLVPHGGNVSPFVAAPAGPEQGNPTADVTEPAAAGDARSDGAAPTEPAPEAEPQPAVRPIVIGAEPADGDASPRRRLGWWRR